MIRTNTFLAFLVLAILSGCGAETGFLQTNPDVVDSDAPSFRPDTIPRETCDDKFRQCLRNALTPVAYDEIVSSYDELRDESHNFRKCRREYRRCVGQPDYSTAR